MPMARSRLVRCLSSSGTWVGPYSWTRPRFMLPSFWRRGTTDGARAPTSGGAATAGRSDPLLLASLSAARWNMPAPGLT